MIEVINSPRRIRRWTVKAICACFGTKRDSYYKHQSRQDKVEMTSELALGLVKIRRKDQPREGCRKLHQALRQSFESEGLKIGRDTLYDILRSKHMLVLRRRSGVRTTNSYHHFHKYTNLIKDLKITRPNQVWVCDITYLQLVHGHCYLVLITDVYSRKIVGYDVSESLELAGCLRAFKRARRQARPARGLIHHSDRGVQYCSNQYVNLLKKHGVQISMTEENHCYENAMAERVNGILKDEFYLDKCFADVHLAQKACDNAIKVYNTIRLHLSLGYKIPEDVFRMSA